MNYECECGKPYKTRGWLTRHRYGCAVFQATAVAVMTRATRQAFVPKMVTSLYTQSPLMKILTGRAPVEKPVTTFGTFDWRSYLGINPTTKTVT